MTICPIAIAVGCEKCPAFKFCPLTTVLGDQEEEEEPTSKVWEESFQNGYLQPKNRQCTACGSDNVMPAYE